MHFPTPIVQINLEKSLKSDNNIFTTFLGHKILNDLTMIIICAFDLI